MKLHLRLRTRREVLTRKSEGLPKYDFCSILLQVRRYIEHEPQQSKVTSDWTRNTLQHMVSSTAAFKASITRACNLCLSCVESSPGDENTPTITSEGTAGSGCATRDIVSPCLAATRYCPRFKPSQFNTNLQHRPPQLCQPAWPR